MKSVKTFMLGATVLCLVFWLPMELTPKFILSLFTKDQNLIAYGFEYFRLGLVLPRFVGGIGVWYSIPMTDIIVFIVAMCLVVIEFKKMLKPTGAFVQR